MGRFGAFAESGGDAEKPYAFPEARRASAAADPKGWPALRHSGRILRALSSDRTHPFVPPADAGGLLGANGILGQQGHKLRGERAIGKNSAPLQIRLRSIGQGDRQWRDPGAALQMAVTGSIKHSRLSTGPPESVI